MSLNNDQLKEYFQDEFKDLKIRLSVNEDKSNEILRRLDVIDHQQKDLRDTLYGPDALLEQFTVLKTEHAGHKANCNPSVVVAKKSLKVERTAVILSALAIVIALFKDVFAKLLF